MYLWTCITLFLMLLLQLKTWQQMVRPEGLLSEVMEHWEEGQEGVEVPGHEGFVQRREAILLVCLTTVHTKVEHMLESIRQYLSLSGAEWDLAADHHSRYHPELERTGNQLKKIY